MPDTMTATAQEITFTAPGAAPPALPMERAPAEAPTSMLAIIDRASRDPGTDIDKLERLIALKERMDARDERAEFDRAMVDAQEAMRAIAPDKENKQTHSEYATYAALDAAVRPIYSKHGFALSFNTGDAPNAAEVRVMCTVSHRGGHRQDYKIDMPADGKGPQGAAVMTRTHATGAAASYGQRYLLKLIFNLAVGDIDDDGNGASGADEDIDRMGTGPRGADGKLLSTYDVEKVRKAAQWADGAVQRLNLMSGPMAVEEAKAWRNEAQTVPPGKRKAPLDWLKDNSPGQYLRVRQVYQNVTSEDLE